LTAATKAGQIPAQVGAQPDHFILHTGDLLAKDLQIPQYGRPLALGSVVDEAVRTKALVPLQDFLDAKQSIYTKSWIPTPWQAISWGLRQIGMVGKGHSEDELMSGNFVIMANVEEAAKSVLGEVFNTATSNTSRIMSPDNFQKTVSTATGLHQVSSTDLSVLLRHLARDHAAIAHDLSTGTVKFKASSDLVPPSIQQEDVTIATLHSMISSLELQIQQLMKRISELDVRVRELVSSKQLAVAKNVLRQKKLAGTKLQQRTDTLAQLEAVYNKIEQAQDQVELVRVLEASSQALRNLNQKIGNVEKVQDVMEGLRDEMMNMDEIQQAINEVSAGAVDEGEVEDELEALEKAEKHKLEEAERHEREAKEAREAEETKKKLAELDKLGGSGVLAVPDPDVKEELKRSERLQE